MDIEKLNKEFRTFLNEELINSKQFKQLVCDYINSQGWDDTSYVEHGVSSFMKMNTADAIMLACISELASGKSLAVATQLYNELNDIVATDGSLNSWIVDNYSSGIYIPRKYLTKNVINKLVSKKTKLTADQLCEYLISHNYQVPLQDNYTYRCVPATTEYIDMPEKLEQQLKSEGLYGNTYISAVCPETLDRLTTSYLPIFGDSTKYVTKWFNSDMKWIVSDDMRQMKLNDRLAI